MTSSIITWLIDLIKNSNKRSRRGRRVYNYEYDPENCHHEWPEWNNWKIDIMGGPIDSKINIRAFRERRCPLCGKSNDQHLKVGDLFAEITEDGEVVELRVEQD